MAILVPRTALISASALVLAFSYILCTLWWGIFIFLVPLFFCVLQYTVTPVRDGLLWGVLFWTIQYYGIIYVLYEKAEGEWRLLAGLFLIIYSTIYVILWFLVATKTAKIYNNKQWALLCWGAATFAYFYWVRYHMFFIFNQNIGYCFGYPTLLLAQCPRTLVLLAMFGSHLFLALIITSACSAAQALYDHSYKKLLLAIVVLAPFGAGLVWMPTNTKPEGLPLLGYVSPNHANKNMDAYEYAHAINEKITELIIRQPTVHAVVMPESAYPFYLNQHTQTLELWGTNALCDDTRLLIGAYRIDEEGKCHNSCYNIRRGRIISFYDKILQFPFVEYCPFNVLKGLFLKNKQEFTPQRVTAHPFELTSSLSLLPVLCSDLFFDLTITGEHTYPLLFAVNDDWFTITYMRNLMFLFAAYKSMELTRDIIYVSYYKGVWLSPSTKHWPLLC